MIDDVCLGLRTREWHSRLDTCHLVLQVIFLVLGFSRAKFRQLAVDAQNPVPSFPGSPFRVPVKDVVDPSKVKIAGPGLGTGVRARVLQSFTVDSSKAGLAPLEVRVLGPRGEYSFCLPADIDLPRAETAITQSRYFAFKFGQELKIKFLK